ncbi:hypothetical protein THIOM_001521 [Candidatus Thiomargarita nelsonii]|uniref:Type I restriction enzyme R protein N-terminal domain-containing protein n=1 Tax=Candidatus Thiomargarita nelsonii TaxID=1003181 RepID=A0A176S3M2_9GAMM|nr:hypothetical protein THIOM_001521 [Candidatus Thiomargarita nelsonii]
MGKLNFKEGKKYTFSDYFDFNNPPEEIANEFGYEFDTQAIDFSLANEPPVSEIKKLQEIFYENLPKITLNMAKRDFMIAPLLWEIIRHVKAKINVEYPIEIDDKLGGLLDYLVHSEQEIIIIEAKKGDLDKGFNQLITELIAMDKYQGDNESLEFLYGAVSIGELWRFGILNRKAKNILRDLHTYRVPEDIEAIFSIIVGILQKA